MQPIPVIVLSGFLGSGKTTLLKRLVTTAKEKNLKAALLVNELGQHDVDGQILKGLVGEDQLGMLLDGCLCCTKKSEIHACLAKLIQLNPDLIFIELTGVANPEEVADALTEPDLLDQVRLHKTITVVDTDFFLEFNSILHPDKQSKQTLRQQVETADLILLNKIDLVRDRTIKAVKKAVRRLNPQAPLILTEQSRIDTAPVFNGIRRRQSISAAISSAGKQPTPDHSHSHNLHSHDHASSHHHGSTERSSFGMLQTTVIHLPEQTHFSRKTIRKWTHTWGKGILRAKGYIILEGQLQIMHYAGSRLYFDSCSCEESMKPYLVLIGFQEEIRRQAQALKEWVIPMNE